MSVSFPGRVSPPSAELSGVDHAAKIGLSQSNLIVALLEHSDDCIKMLNLDGTLDYMNCGGLKAMQIDDFASVAGRKWWDLWPEFRRDAIRQMFTRTLSGNEISFVAICPTARGEDRKWSVKLKPLMAKDCRIAGVICTSRDVTHAPAIAA